MEPLISMLKTRAAMDTSSDVSITDNIHSLSHSDVWRAVCGGADWLRVNGVGDGDRVVIHGNNSVSFAISYFACHAAGAVAVPIGSDMGLTGVESIVSKCRPSLILTMNLDRIYGVKSLAFPTLAEWMATDTNQITLPEMTTAADLLFTTGTTGEKKGVLLTHDNISHAAVNINAFIGAVPSDIEVIPVPLSHSFGLGRLRCWALIGHRVHLESGMRNPAAIFKTLIDLRATGMAIVPAGIALMRLALRGKFAALSEQLRYIELGSAPISDVDSAWLLEMLPNTRVCHHYGLTEASRAAFRELRHDHVRSGTIGRASPNVEIQISGEREPDKSGHAIGEIMVRGGMVMKCYWDQDDLTRSTLRDGWLHTGDDGWIDDDGYVYLHGRRRDTINVGGLKVSPQEVESQILAIAGVEDAGCIGIPDPKGVRGQVVKAFLVGPFKLNTSMLLTTLRTSLAEHELPCEFEWIEAIPRTESGKIMRGALRQRQRLD